MKVTYKEIVGGYILEEGDTLVIHGIEYTVELSVSYPYYFLREKNYKCNDLVFNRLGIKDKQDYCERIVGKESVFFGIFPKIDTLENLTKVVRALYERSPYYDEFEKAKSSPAVTRISSADRPVGGDVCGIYPVSYHEIRKDFRPDCHFDDEPIIINNPKSKTKTTIKL